MTVLPFNRAGTEKKPVELEDETFQTYFAMFSHSEQLLLGLLMGRTHQDGTAVFKNIQLEAAQDCASLTLSFTAQDPPYVHIDKIRAGKSNIFRLRRENMPTIVQNGLNDIYEIARDDINMLLGEPLFDSNEAVIEQKPHLSLVEP